MEVVFEVLIRIRETGVRDFVGVSYYFYRIYSLVTLMGMLLHWLRQIIV